MDEPVILAVLRACRPVADRLAADPAAPLAGADQQALAALRQLEAAGAFDADPQRADWCAQAGLTYTAWWHLMRRLTADEFARDPVGPLVGYRIVVTGPTNRVRES
ncbi:MAG: hypothetical protein M3Z04_02645 [Chloroflexota bacterium]|nr:hypothetical protein [Chloroflexota bacterium]